MYMCSFVRVCMQTFIFTRTAIASEISWHKNEMDDESSSVDSRKPPTNQPTNQPASERASSQRDLPFSFCVQSTYICMYVGMCMLVYLQAGKSPSVSQSSIAFVDSLLMIAVVAVVKLLLCCLAIVAVASTAADPAGPGMSEQRAKFRLYTRISQITLHRQTYIHTYI